MALEKGQVFFEDVAAGVELPPLVKEITLPQMAMYAAACWDFQPIHYDSGTAQSLGFRAAFTDGPMETAFLCQVLTDWMGMQGVLKKVSASYRGMVFPGDRLTCRGRVSRKFKEGDEGLVGKRGLGRESGRAEGRLWDRPGAVALSVRKFHLPPRGEGRRYGGLIFCQVR